MNVSRSLALAAFAAVAAVAPVRGQDAATTVPFTFVDNRMMIECTIDGKGPFVMALDTGSSGNVITPETAQRIGVTVAANGTTYGAGEERSRTAARNSLRWRSVRARSATSIRPLSISPRFERS